MNTTIKDRVRKLLNLAGNNPNEAEAAAAAEKASRLMLEHGLLEADIVSDDDSQKVTEIRKVYAAKLNHWHGALAYGISKLNMCESYFETQYENISDSPYRTKFTRQTGMVFVGKPSQVEVSHSMLEYLIEAIERQAKNDLRYQKKWHVSRFEERGYWTKYRNSFRYGAAVRLRDRMEEIATTRDLHGMESSTGQHITALTVLTARQQQEAAIQDFMRDMKITSNRASGPSSLDGFSAGKQAGDNISLHSQVGSTSNAPRITYN